jgi:hypothetical protein
MPALVSEQNWRPMFIPPLLRTAAGGDRESQRPWLDSLGSFLFLNPGEPTVEASDPPELARYSSSAVFRTASRRGRSPAPKDERTAVADGERSLQFELVYTDGKYRKSSSLTSIRSTLCVSLCAQMSATSVLSIRQAVVFGFPHKFARFEIHAQDLRRGSLSEAMH